MMNEDKVRELICELKQGGSLMQEKVIRSLEALIEPERICGLTMEEWQVVIDGGYLCEFGDNCIAQLRKEKEGIFYTAKGRGSYHACRPYRAAGHVQPYFDNDECREYLDGLSEDAMMIRHDRNTDEWRPCGITAWNDCDKFIVLSNE